MDGIKSIIIYFFLIFQISYCIVVIPFRTYKLSEPGNFTLQTAFEIWKKNILYSYIYIGTPPQKIIMIIDSQSFTTNLFQHMCDIDISLYNKSESSSFYKRESVIYFPMINASIIDETLYLYTSLKMDKLNEFTLFKLIYSDNIKEDQKSFYEYHNNTCINIGLRIKPNREIEQKTNLINQLSKKLKENNIFTIKYISNDEGMLIIGKEPHFYEQEIYSEKDYRKIGTQDYSDWNLIFDEIYLSYKDKISGDKIKHKLNETLKIKIKFELGIIYGPKDYKEIIKKNFFNKRRKMLGRKYKI